MDCAHVNRSNLHNCNKCAIAGAPLLKLSALPTGKKHLPTYSAKNHICYDFCWPSAALLKLCPFLLYCVHVHGSNSKVKFPANFMYIFNTFTLLRMRKDEFTKISFLGPLATVDSNIKDEIMKYNCQQTLNEFSPHSLCISWWNITFTIISFLEQLTTADKNKNIGIMILITLQSTFCYSTWIQ